MRFSIIIPVYNDPEGLSQTISSLQKIESDEQYEILIVDNNSTDVTRDIANNFADNMSNTTVLVEDNIQSSYVARNLGIEYASGDILVFLDADMTVQPDYLQLLDEYFMSRDVDLVGCNVELYQPEENNTFFGRYDVATAFPIQLYIEKENFVPTCCLSVRQDVINDVGNFLSNVESGGDTEFGDRVTSAGYSQHFAGHISVYHPARTSLQEHLSKAIRVGKGRAQISRLSTIDSGRPWYHFRNFFPPNPWRFYLRSQSNINIYNLLPYYIFNYVLKLFVLIGQIKENIVTFVSDT